MRKCYLFGAALLAGVCVFQASAEYPASSYSISGTTLTKWMGSETEIDLSSDPAFDAVTTIGISAFQNSNVKSIILPENLTTIERLAFMDCHDLLSVGFNSKLQNIGNAAFSTCTSLQQVDLPDGLLTLGNSSFYDCSGLKSVSIHGSLQEIPYAAFSDCSSLETVDLGEGVMIIGEEAFEGCSSLKSVTGTEDLTVISASAFEECSSLETFIFQDSLQEIGARAFAYSGFKTADLSAITSSCSFGNNIFFVSTLLESVTLPQEEPSFGDGLFYGCSSLKELVIPDSYTSVPAKICHSCSSLEKVTIGQNVTLICNTAFLNCTSLQEVIFNSELQQIDWNAFSYCESLTNISFPSSLQKIDDWAFYSCSSLAEVALGPEITLLGQEVFEGCPSLRTFTCLASTPPTLGQWCFYNTPTESATLFVPEESIDSYKAADQWKDFGSIQSAATGVGSITDKIGNPETYYDLSGRMSETPRSGIFIRRSSEGQVSKVILP